MSLFWTWTIIAVSAAVAAFCRWYETRPRELGEVPMFPSTLVLGLAMFALVGALAHLVVLLTGVPMHGRMGF